MISDSAREQIREHAIREYPKECCGFVVVTRHGYEQVVPCLNTHENPTEFIRCSPEEQFRVDQLGEKICFYHSHPNEGARLTDADKTACEAMDLPWIVYAYPLNQWASYEPSGWVAPLIGRKFVHGVHDCYAVVRDYYQQVCKIELPDFERVDAWWERGENLYLDNFEKAGFVKVNDLKVHDGILMQAFSPQVNHAAVYLGQNIILHHMYGRLSCRTVYGGIWLKNTRIIVRHKSLL